MSETKHTPGPWTWEDWQQDDGSHRNTLTADPQYRYGYDPNGMFPKLRHRLFCDENMELSEADKALIAAAPDLLKILTRMTEWAGGMDADKLPSPWAEMVKEARAVIAAATEKS